MMCDQCRKDATRFFRYTLGDDRQGGRFTIYMFLKYFKYHGGLGNLTDWKECSEDEMIVAEIMES